MSLKNIDNDGFYNLIKKLTLEEIANILNNSKNIPQENEKEKIIKNDKTIFTIDELLNCYPFFTRYSLNNAIKKEGLPFVLIGKKKLFDKEAVENWLKLESTNKRDKIKLEL